MAILYRKPISQEQCNELESQLMLKLPNDYTSFLRQYNGIFVSPPDYVDIPFDKGSIAFSALFGYGVMNRNLNIVALTNELQDEINFLSDAVVIGDDGGDNFFVLIHRSTTHGVFYWDRTHLHDGNLNPDLDIPEHGECGNLYFVAETFSHFWQILLTQISSFNFMEQEA